MDLATFQADFWHDLWAPPGTPPRSAWAGHPGFAVHRNTVLAGGIDTLRAQYPAVRRLSGGAFFDAVALRHLHAHPPSDGRLMAYGSGLADTLADVLSERGLGADRPWLPLVARLDRAWTEAHLAPAAPTARADWLARLATLDAAAFAACRLRLHPATRWHHDPVWPAHALWSAARHGVDDPAPPVRRGEGVLFTRPAVEVLAVGLGAAEAALLAACAADRPLPEALSAALDTAPDADAGALLGRLLAQGAFLDDLPGA